MWQVFAHFTNIFIFQCGDFLEDHEEEAIEIFTKEGVGRDEAETQLCIEQLGEYQHSYASLYIFLSVRSYVHLVVIMI